MEMIAEAAHAACNWHANDGEMTTMLAFLRETRVLAIEGTRRWFGAEPSDELVDFGWACSLMEITAEQTGLTMEDSVQVLLYLLADEEPEPQVPKWP